MALGKSSSQITLSFTLQRAGLVPIGNGIYLRREIPPSDSFSDATISTKSFNPSIREPNIILVFGWMGAKLPHILKYTKVYKDMYPNATQIIVQSEPHFFWSSKRTRMNNLVPAAEVLEAHGCNGTRQESPRDGNSPHILSLSDTATGGGLQMYTLGNLLRTRSGSSSGSRESSPHVSAIVIDSCPGNASFRGAIQAFTAALPKNSFLRVPVIFFITLLYGFGIIRHRIFGVRPIFERLKEGLLRKGSEGGILPWMTEKTPRMYICSNMDELIPVEQVEDHVKEARYRGLNAKIVVYEDTSHVAHARRYPEQYWGAVKDLWAQAVEGQ
ncbi:hypothetical protein EV368DRAFT_83458 [Lentinula lateritia]|nr:hypothetical protein EV368DRAFT_83458 [Lentinula lateritia]